MRIKTVSRAMERNVSLSVLHRKTSFMVHCWRWWMRDHRCHVMSCNLPSHVFFLPLADVLSEEAILKWYNESHLAKGKSVFLEQMKKFVEWLKNAEEGKRARLRSPLQSARAPGLCADCVGALSSPRVRVGGGGGRLKSRRCNRRTHSGFYVNNNANAVERFLNASLFRSFPLCSLPPHILLNCNVRALISLLFSNRHLNSFFSEPERKVKLQDTNGQPLFSAECSL